MPSGPRSVAIVDGCAGLAEAGLGVRVGVGVAVFSPATNAATASISAADSEPLKAGIVPLPFSTVVLTTAALGLRLSRFGPTLPFVPAAASVWQPPQLEVKTFLPSGAAAAATAARGRGGGVVLRPDQRRPDEQREHGEGGRQPGDRREDAVDAPQHVRERGSRSR